VELDVAVAWAVKNQLVRVDGLPNLHNISPPYDGLSRHVDPFDCAIALGVGE